MRRLAILRHGRTEWSAVGRMQGRVDHPLSEAGRAEVARWRLPADLAGFAVTSSPLLRCRETAALLGPPTLQDGPPILEPRLIEMDWGAWEGQELDDLRRRHGERMRELEARGLDFRPPGGESPREVQARLRPWLQATGAGSADILAITHKGVIRALYALSSGWDMLGKPPDRLKDAAVHVFCVSADGVPRLERANIWLEPGGCDAP